MRRRPPLRAARGSYMGTGPGTLILAIGVAVGGAAGAAFGALANEPPDGGGGGGGGGRGGEEASQSSGGAATRMTTSATAAVRRAPFAPLPLWASLVVCGSCYTVYVMPFFDTQMWCLRSDYTLSFRRVRSFFLSFFLFFSRSPTPANWVSRRIQRGQSVGVNLNRCGGVSRCSFISWVQESTVSTTVELGASLALPLAAFVIDNHHGGRVLPSAAAAPAASSSAWRGGPRAACLVGGVLMALGYGAALTALVSSGRREWRPLLRVVAEPPEPDAPRHCHLHLSTRHRRAHRMADVTAVRRRAHGETRHRQNRVEQNGTEQNRTEQNRTEQEKTERNRTEQKLMVRRHQQIEQKQKQKQKRKQTERNGTEQNRSSW